jgi:hypothetical protein
LVSAHPDTATKPPFLDAPYVHQNNQPKYHAMLLRAVEHAKRGWSSPRQLFWVKAIDSPLKPSDIGRTPEEVDKKLARFLQFHDQMTKGIPGLWPLYMHAPVRVTEKIRHSQKITVLKHTSGRIVGWELHTGDLDKGDGDQILLGYLPRVVFVEFDNVTWQLPGLPKGVLPIAPMTHTWILNKATETKIARQGFPLVPDFASTAFMMQGESLNAMLADCGDIWNLVTLSQMLTCYVILSRLRTAHGLLLLQPFSPRLFSQGEPPGPQCLLEFLHARFCSTRGQLLNDSELTSEPQQQQFLTMTKAYQKERNMQKVAGLQWTCSMCAHKFPAQGFGVSATDTPNTLKLCVLPGAWRRCKACRSKEDPKLWHARFQLQKCEICQIQDRPENMNHLHNENATSLRYQCKPCFRNEAKIFCTVWKKD